LGPDGVLAATPDNFLEVPAMDIQPVDTVGAGDTFCGYLAAGLSMDLSLEKVLARAAAAGSLACLKAGAQPSIPLASEVDTALSRRAR
jgi:ribokinase